MPHFLEGRDCRLVVYIATAKPESAPAENWLPINHKDENMDIVFRIYVPDLEKMET